MRSHVSSAAEFPSTRRIAAHTPPECSTPLILYVLVSTHLGRIHFGEGFHDKGGGHWKPE